MSKKRGPALYELISNKAQDSPPPRTQKKPKKKSLAQPEFDVDLEHNLFTPGRTFRISIGSIGVIAAVCIALIVISYTLGFRKGTAVAREDYGNRLFEEIPLETTGAPQSNESQIPILNPNQPPANIGNSQWKSVLSDPRVQNHFYFTLMQTTKEGAMQLAAFCRQKGLETYVVSGNNTRLYRVVALPGSTDRNATSLNTVLAQIHAIGQEWARTKAGGGSDLQDAYLSIKSQ